MNLSQFTTKMKFTVMTPEEENLESPFNCLSKQKDSFPVLGSTELFNHLDDGTKKLSLQEFEKHNSTTAYANLLQVGPLNQFISLVACLT